MNTYNDVTMKEFSSNNTNQIYFDPIPKIRVVVRKRPLNKREINKNEMDIIDIRHGNSVIVKELKTKVDLTKYVEEHNFTFDMAYDVSTTNETIYLDAVRPMIEAAFNKTKVTCFAYGQTGSGKTFTMMGPGTNALEMGTPGLYLLSAFDIFSYLEYECYNHLEIYVSFYEIYCGKLYDLLNDRALLTAREDGKQNICIVGLTEKQATNLTSMMQLIEYGLKCRTVGVTGANSDSSRSHGIIQIAIKESNGNPHGKISFIDLAGSERAADTIDTNKQTKIDGAEINKSLLALKECIRALDQDKKYTPFRGSKLTLVLRDSFMGNCKTLMIANISPCLTCSEHTLNTLRYADRVKELRGRENKDPRANDNINIENAAKDPHEVLANLLMMPRQHGKTIKYAVDKNNNPVRSSISGSNTNNSTNYNSNNINTNKIASSLPNQVNKKLPNTNFTNTNLNQNQIGSTNTSNSKSANSFNNYTSNINKENTNTNLENHLFNLLNNNKAGKSTTDVSNNLTGNNNANKFPNSYVQPGQNMNSNSNPNLNLNFSSYPGHNNPQTGSNVNNFLANYSSFNKRNSNTSQNSHLSKSPSTNEISEEELQKLSERHEKLISKILIEEESYIENHRKHVDSIVEIIKEEMSLVNEVEKPGSDIEFYVNSMEKVFNQQLEKINFMKNRLITFKNLLKEEEEVSQKFLKLNEMMGSMLTDSFHCNSQSNYSKNDDLNNFDEGY